MARSRPTNAIAAMPLDVAEAAGFKSAIQLHPIQTEFMLCEADEILLCGGKGWGKSYASRAWLISGNPHKEGPLEPVDLGYYLHPEFTGLVVRQNVKDLEDWIRQGMNDFYSAVGAWVTHNPMQIHFPKYDSNGQPIPNTEGAIIYTGHLDDDESWKHYLGTDIHRLIVEEVVIIPSPDRYNLLKTCVRSSVPGIRPQIVLSCNPLGPGVGWLRKMFIDRKDSTQKWKSGEIQLVEEYFPPLKKTLTKKRSYFHGTVLDNSALNAEHYIAGLLDNPGHIARAYVYGDWEASAGQMFPRFRHKGPIMTADTNGVETLEPENANHVIRHTEGEVRIANWMRRVIGADWGYNHNAAFIKYAIDEEKDQYHICKEFSEAGFSTFDFGVEIGLAIREEVLEYGLSIPIFLSRDAFSRESEVAVEAKRISEGIKSIVGGNRVRVMGEDLEDMLDAPRGSVIVRPAYNARVAGWTYMDDCMRWKRSLPESHIFNQKEAWEVMVQSGEEEYKKYMNLWQAQLEPEVLPKLQIWDSCTRIVQAIQNAPVDKRNPADVERGHWEGADILEAARYGLMGIRQTVQKEPVQVTIERSQKELADKGMPLDMLRRRAMILERQADKEARGGLLNTFIPGSRRMRKQTLQRNKRML